MIRGVRLTTEQKYTTAEAPSTAPHAVFFGIQKSVMRNPVQRTCRYCQHDNCVYTSVP